MKIRISAFSLIELMVVIAIVAMLSALAVPAYQRYIFTTEENQKINMMLQVFDRVNQYVAENGSVPSTLSDVGFVDELGSYGWANYSNGCGGSSSPYCAQQALMIFTTSVGSPLEYYLEYQCITWYQGGQMHKACLYTPYNALNQVIEDDYGVQATKIWLNSTTLNPDYETIMDKFNASEQAT